MTFGIARPLVAHEQAASIASAVATSRIVSVSIIIIVSVLLLILGIPGSFAN